MNLTKNGLSLFWGRRTFTNFRSACEYTINQNYLLSSSDQTLLVFFFSVHSHKHNQITKYSISILRYSLTSSWIKRFWITKSEPKLIFLNFTKILFHVHTKVCSNGLIISKSSLKGYNKESKNKIFIFSWNFLSTFVIRGKFDVGTRDYSSSDIE